MGVSHNVWRNHATSLLPLSSTIETDAFIKNTKENIGCQQLLDYIISTNYHSKARKAQTKLDN